jgi:bifunctional diaminopimelate decarboxylase / aspartate kinase
MQKFIVTKFGGTSVSSRKTWDKILSITKNHLKHDLKPLIVCSAIQNASNQLEAMLAAAITNSHGNIQENLQKNYLALAQDLEVDGAIIEPELAQLNAWLTGIALLKEAPYKTHAQILSLGEIMLTKLGAKFLQERGVNCYWLDAQTALTSIPDHNPASAYCKARVDVKPNTQLQQDLNPHQVILTQGFIAANAQGETVLLGRGGSDTSASLFSVSLEASCCEIWTDVPGIYTANPHELAQARLQKKLHYDEAQEIASLGAKVLHPLCIPPVKAYNIPMVVKYTLMPEHSGTRISNEYDETAPLIKSIQTKSSISVLSIDTINMWHNIGFLADIFQVFKTHELSVDLLATSEANVTLSLDTIQTNKQRESVKQLLEDLSPFGKVKLIEPCSSISLIGHHIRRSLSQLGSAIDLFSEQKVYLMTLSSNDLNLTIVTDESKTHKIAHELHKILIENNPQSYYYSKSWQEEFGEQIVQELPWWQAKRSALLQIGAEHSPAYVYDAEKITSQVAKLKSITAIDRLFYAVKANPNANILRLLDNHQVGFECVSLEELTHVKKVLPHLKNNAILFTPNFAARSEYAYALEHGFLLTIDNLHPLEHWGEIFNGTEIFIRIDLGSGLGHHKFVCTGGDESKFGIPLNYINKIKDLCQKHNIKVIGLHSHSGSGILSPHLWQNTALSLIKELEHFPQVKYLNLGGGLGVVEQPGQQPIDLNFINESLLAVKSQHKNLEFWLEPGRFFVAEAGVLLAQVTQCKEKGKVNFIGINTGMNSLIRPMLYGAYHTLVNLSRIDSEATYFAHVVGPICESGDTLAYDRLLPQTYENDIILIANAGAYGRAMSSSYNLREPAQEIML